MGALIVPVYLLYSFSWIAIWITLYKAAIYFHVGEYGMALIGLAIACFLKGCKLFFKGMIDE